MDERSNKDILVLLAVIATVVVLAVVFTWTRADQPSPPLDTDIRTTPGAPASP